MQYEKESKDTAKKSEVKVLSLLESHLKDLEDNNVETRCIINDLYSILYRIIGESEDCQKNCADAIAPSAHLDVFCDQLSFQKTNINRLSYLCKRLNELV